MSINVIVTKCIVLNLQTVVEGYLTKRGDRVKVNINIFTFYLIITFSNGHAGFEKHNLFSTGKGKKHYTTWTITEELPV